MRVLVDTNIILDVMLGREPFFADAAIKLQRIESGKIDGFVAATTVTNIFYVVRKARGIEMAKQAVAQILTGVQIKLSCI